MLTLSFKHVHRGKIRSDREWQLET